jgi:hypothetical protein
MLITIFISISFSTLFQLFLSFPWLFHQKQLNLQRELKLRQL